MLLSLCVTGELAQGPHFLPTSLAHTSCIGSVECSMTTAVLLILLTAQITGQSGGDAGLGSSVEVAKAKRIILLISNSTSPGRRGKWKTRQ
jgi:hypothetical protein